MPRTPTVVSWAPRRSLARAVARAGGRGRGRRPAAMARAGVEAARRRPWTTSEAKAAPRVAKGRAPRRRPAVCEAQVLQKLQEKCSSNSRSSYPAAMYSSVVGGIILEPAMMALPIDDHIVHRGHDVFDTAMLLDGCLYELDAHLDRFLRSAAKALIDTAPFLRHALRAILIKMTATFGCRKGSIRYWLSFGSDDFLLSSAGCPAPAFYAVVIAADYDQCRHGVRAVTTSVPMKPPLFATVKNVNYLLNSCTAKRLLALAPKLVDARPRLQCGAHDRRRAGLDSRDRNKGGAAQPRGRSTDDATVGAAGTKDSSQGAVEARALAAGYLRRGDECHASMPRCRGSR